MDSRGYYRTPTISGDLIVFVCEDDLWSVPVAGGVARRLTAGPGACALPRLSPDGSTVAYVGRDEGNPEVYTIPVAGGRPRRLTFFGSDALYVSGWSADGTEIYFTSDYGVPFVKETVAFAIARDGGEPRRLAVGHAMTIDVAANGATLLGRNNIDPARWKRYRGGTAGHIWVDPSGDGSFVRAGKALDGNLVWPMWYGGRIAFLSDHEGIGNLYAMDADGANVTRLTDEREYFARYPATDGTRIVYACGGDIVVLDPAHGSAAQRVPIETPSSAPQTARRFVDASDHLETYVPSPDGTALALVARGRAYTMPLWEAAVSEHGGPVPARRREIVWLHDGRRVAYVDDSAGHERIAVVAVDQSAPPTYVTAGDVGRITELVASPCSDRLAFANHKHELYALDLGAEPRLLDTSRAWRCIDLAFSPDGRWLAYAWAPKASTSIIRIADCDAGGVFDVTEPLREDRAPAWDPEGKYLYFISARDFNPVYDALQFDLSFPQAMRPYVATLRSDVANPFVALPAPIHRSKDDDDDDDKDDADGDEKAPKKPAPVAIDAAGLPRRILAFPVEEGSYHRIAGVKGRAVFSRFPVEGIKASDHDDDDDGGGTLAAYDFTQLRSATFATEVDDFVVGADARTLVYESRGKLRAIDAGGELPDDEPDDKPATETNRRSGWLDLARVGVLVEPPSEWAQMLREAWRLQREQFWDPQMSGIDWDAVLVRYEALVPRLRTRAELSDLIWEMQGELGTSHAYESGGDVRVPPQYKRGFLGADYRYDAERGGYRIDAILRGDSWNRGDDSPLAEPGLDVRAGDTITGVGGTRVTPGRTPDELLVNLAGRDVALDIVRDGAPRRVLVHALRDERTLRYRAWVNANRALVHERTGGRVGYVHIPDMGPWGFAEFHRGYLTEFERDGLIVDVRYNRGGHVSPLLLEKLARKRVGYDIARYGPPQPYPPESLGGPLVALTNQFAGSDGDIFSHCFKLYGLGTLIGMRTWGGVVGINPYHELVDGTTTTQPEYSFWFADAGWGVENYGTDPDVEVDIAPQDSAAGVDPQMETALRLIGESLGKAAPKPDFFPYPNRAYPPPA